MRRTCVLLVMPSRMQVLSIGMYCFVIILITSCDAIPPIIAEILCSSPPLARETSSAAWTTRGLEQASGVVFLMVAMISDVLAEGTCEVAFKARYMGRRESGIMVKEACSSLSNSRALIC